MEKNQAYYQAQVNTGKRQTDWALITVYIRHRLVTSGNYAGVTPVGSYLSFTYTYLCLVLGLFFSTAIFRSLPIEKSLRKYSPPSETLCWSSGHNRPFASMGLISGGKLLV